MNGSVFRLVFPVIVSTFFALLPAAGLSATFVAFGPEDYARGSGSPVAVNHGFTVSNPNSTYTLQIYNGGLTDGESERVLSSVIALNGLQIVGPREFNQNVTLIETPVALSSSNHLSVELRGKPGGGITIQVIGVDNDPPTIAAKVNPVPNAAGWHKSDVTVSFTCGDLISGIAVCPSPVTVSSEGVNQLVSGTATDLAGNSVTASRTINLDKTPPAVAITAPADGATISSSSLTVTGTISEARSGIAIVGCNGTPASLSESTFSCEVPLSEGSNSILVEAVDVAGNAGSSSLTVNLVEAPGPTIAITSPTAGKVVERDKIWVRGEMGAPAGVSEVTVDGEPAVANGGKFGAFVPVELGANAVSATLFDLEGNVAIDTILVIRQEPTPPDFFGLWNGLKEALRVGDIAGALDYIAQRSRERYQGIFDALGAQLVDIDQILTDITVMVVREDDAEFEMMRDGRSFFVHFTKDDDGIWRIAAL